MPTTDQQPAPFALPVRTHEKDSHILVSADGEYLGRSVYAKHIVRAINSHDALVKALAEMVRGNDVEDFPEMHPGQVAGEFTYGDLRRALAALKTATL